MRFVVALAIGLLLVARAASAETLAAPTSQGPVEVQLFAAPGDAPRPTVLILHGRDGANPPAAYLRHADHLAAAGIDAWLFTYYTAADAEVMFKPGRDEHIALFMSRIGAWAKTIDELVEFALTRPRSSGRVGLLGVSNGGFLAVGAAAADPRIAAIVVFYGGVPRPLERDIARLPPLLALHGDVDRIIPVDSGRALVDRARALGSEAELVVYPGAGHGFDFDLDSGTGNDAREPAIKFLASHLLLH
jgi:carboxymethylenebutenolidase